MNRVVRFGIELEEGGERFECAATETLDKVWTLYCPWCDSTFPNAVEIQEHVRGHDRTAWPDHGKYYRLREAQGPDFVSTPIVSLFLFGKEDKPYTEEEKQAILLARRQKKEGPRDSLT